MTTLDHVTYHEETTFTKDTLKPSVLVMGCGPAGLIAAQAAFHFGCRVIHTVSKKEKSPLPGAQYLHAPIPRVTAYEPRGTLTYYKRGSRTGYALKVYGSRAAPVSWDEYEAGDVEAWDIHQTYDDLWKVWEPTVRDFHLSGAVARRVCQGYDIVFNSIPAPMFCKGGCQFDGQKVWITETVEDYVGENEIHYNGESDIPYYRTSRIFGHASTEWTRMVPGAFEAFKPTTHNCECAPGNVVGIGRFGRWDKNMLVHHVYKQVIDALLAMQ